MVLIKFFLLIFNVVSILFFSVIRDHDSMDCRNIQEKNKSTEMIACFLRHNISMFINNGLG